MDGGAWPFLVGGVICLVNSDNERDSPLLTSRLDLDMRGACRPVAWPAAARVFRTGLVVCACASPRRKRRAGVGTAAPTVRCPPARTRAPSKSVAYSNVFLEGFTALKPYETESNNRSVMPLDVLGRTRATMPGTAGVFLLREERVTL